MSKKDEDEFEVVFESVEIGDKPHLWQYEDQGKAMLDAIYHMIGALCPGCQIKALSMICAATICDIVEEGQESFRDILFRCTNEAVKQINADKPRPN